MPHQLGIDTGGTCTDAVLIGPGRRVLAKHKSLTTAYDLTVGIGDALDGLPPALLESVDLVALSTTLSTNSVVEGRGAPVSVLLPGYSESQAEKSGLYRIIEREFVTLLGGGHDAVGDELAPLEVARAGEKITAHAGRVSAFAISALFATRNPAHETRLRDLAAELSGRPVACGHELATALGAPQRALTAALNARMIPHIQALLDAVETILRARGIGAPLMIVKGDGSLVSAQTARRQPLATALSGPAASVTGACQLSGCGDAVVVDMGGTTTDIAVVSGGRPALCADGARIGDWQPMIEAVRVFSAGLGGDSEVTFKGELALSHRRVVPLSLLAHQFPTVLARLELQLRGAPSPRNNRFALRLQKNDALLRQLTPAQLAAWESLADGPAELESLAAAEAGRPRLRALAALERMGLVIYSGFTPSDATHVLGLTAHWDAAAARLAALIWARQMRHLYGCGDWAAGDADAPCRAVFDLVVREIAAKLIEAGLNQHGKLSDSKARNLTRLLSDMILGDGGGGGRARDGNGAMGDGRGGDSGRDGSGDSGHNGGGDTGRDGGGDSGRDGPKKPGRHAKSNGEHRPQPATDAADPPLFHLQFARGYPLVAVGGPAPQYFPAVAEALGLALRLPPHAETANAVGAALGVVAQTARVTVTQPQFGVFYLFHNGRPLTFESLDAALEKAADLATREAAAQAAAAGAVGIETRIRRDGNHVKHDIDGELFVSATLTATATGRPAERQQ
ncbi:MAG: hydantoinase/oxoprolinase family protein [Gammaproteobacteria bacterium]|nr:hydantoinase/oxoprolinase family protein [Gammaproteobacteria bacterium]